MFLENHAGILQVQKISTVKQHLNAIRLLSGPFSKWKRKELSKLKNTCKEFSSLIKDDGSELQHACAYVSS